MSSQTSSHSTSRGTQTTPEFIHSHVARKAVARPHASHVRFQAARKTAAARKNIVKRPIYEGPKPHARHSVARKTGMNSWEMDHVVDDVSSDVVDDLPTVQSPQESSAHDWVMPEVLELIECVKEHPEECTPIDSWGEEEEDLSEDVFLIPRSPDTIKVWFLGRYGHLEEFYPPLKGVMTMEDIEAVVKKNYQAGPGNHMSPVDFATLDYFIYKVKGVFEWLEEMRKNDFLDEVLNKECC